MKQDYLYDLHVHTSNVSACGRVNGKEAAQLYATAGYTGIVITDHYYQGFFTRVSGSWQNKVSHYLQGYYEALASGIKHGIDVFLGIEIKFVGSPNDYLAYGISEEFLLENPELFKLKLPGFSKLVRKQGLLLYQAHPFRGYCTPADPKYLDGIEIFNGNPRHQSHNDQAEAYARRHGLRAISGSDFHQYPDLAAGGAYFPEKLKDNEHLVSALKKQEIVKLKKG